MACTTTVHGAGLNVNGCGKLPNEGDYTFTGIATFQDSTYLGCPCKRFFLDGIDQGDGYIFHPSAYVVSTTCPMPTSKYDCVNGVCTPVTNGFYSSLSECQTNCGKQGCSGQCVSSSDWAQIQGLISQLKNRSCG